MNRIINDLRVQKGISRLVNFMFQLGRSCIIFKLNIASKILENTITSSYQVLPIVKYIIGAHSWNCNKIIVKNDMKLKRDMKSTWIHDKCDRTSMTKRIPKVDTEVNLESHVGI